MSTLPDPPSDAPGDDLDSHGAIAPQEPDHSTDPSVNPSPHEVEWAVSQFSEPASYQEPSFAEPPIITYAPQPHRPPRFPNLLDLALVGLLLGLGFFGAGAVTALALHLHLFGVTTFKQATDDIHYTLGSQVAWYCLTFLGCVLLFPLIWHTGFFRGVEWRAGAAFRLWRRLLNAVLLCVVLAFIDALLLPGPKEAPIDQLFKLPGAAWLLFLFGITLAPFFEELGFRGFLLPAFCTCFEWIADLVSGKAAQHVSLRGWRRWPIHAILVAALVTSVPVASLWFAFNGKILICVLICLLWLASLGLAWLKTERRALLEADVTTFESERSNHPEWTLLAMSLMSLYTSIPFALMHSPQNGYSFGPFILLVCVSMVLCWARLRTRSLAASTLVHACYNLLLFATMAIASGGFRHLDKM